MRSIICFESSNVYIKNHSLSFCMETWQAIERKKQKLLFSFNAKKDDQTNAGKDKEQDI